MSLSNTILPRTQPFCLCLKQCLVSIPGWLSICYLAQAGLKLMASIPLTMLSECWNYRCVPDSNTDIFRPTLYLWTSQQRLKKWKGLFGPKCHQVVQDAVKESEHGVPLMVHFGTLACRMFFSSIRQGLWCCSQYPEASTGIDHAPMKSSAFL